jgi:molecular chaperone HscB
MVKGTRENLLALSIYLKPFFMDYFQFYDIPLSFNPDQDVVKKKFYELSKTYHPDFYISESEEKQQEVLEKSTLNNKAFQTLSNSSKLLPYILTLKGVLTEGEKYNLPQEFLMEMMDVNEALMELEYDADDESINYAIADVEALESTLEQELSNALTQFNEAAEAKKIDTLKSIKDIYYRKKYLLRIRESIDKFTNR